MSPLDGQEATMLKFFKDNKIPHTYQCKNCGTWLGKTTNNPNCGHEFVLRDLRPYQKVENGNQNAISDRDSSI